MFMAEHRSYFALLDVERADDEVAGVLRAGSDVYAEDVIRLVREAQQLQLVPDGDPRLYATGILGAVSSFSHALRASTLDHDVHELASFVGDWVVTRAVGRTSRRAVSVTSATRELGVRRRKTRDEGVDDARLELRAACAHDVLVRLERCPCVLVGALAGQRVEHVGDGDDPSAERDVVGHAAGRVPGAVPALVVVQGDLGGELDERRAAARQDLGAHGGVRLHDVELFGGQRARLQQDRVGHGHLADVVQAAGQPELRGPVVGLAQLVGDLGRHVADADGVLAGVGVAELGQHRQALERLELVLLEIVRATADQRLELAGSQAQDLGLLPGGLGVVGDLQGLDAQVGALAEQRLVLGEPCLLVAQRFLEPSKPLVHPGQLGVRAQLVLDHGCVPGDAQRHRGSARPPGRGSPRSLATVPRAMASANAVAPPSVVADAD